MNTSNRMWAFWTHAAVAAISFCIGGIFGALTLSGPKPAAPVTTTAADGRFTQLERAYVTLDRRVGALENWATGLNVPQQSATSQPASEDPTP